YAPWRVRQRLRQADLCLLPAGGDVEGRARSRRRAGLASALGVPVVAAAPATLLLPALRAALKEGPSRSGPEQDWRLVTAAWWQAIEAAQAAVARRPAGGITFREEN